MTTPMDELEAVIVKALEAEGLSIGRMAGYLYVTDPRSATYDFGKLWVRVAIDRA